MATLETSALFSIPGPSPVGKIYLPADYSEYSMRGITGTITNTLGQLNYVFTTNMRLDESKFGKIVLDWTVLPTGYDIEYLTPTQVYQPLNTDGYNWQITTIILMKMAGVTVDFPIGGVNITINMEWSCKPK